MSPKIIFPWHDGYKILTNQIQAFATNLFIDKCLKCYLQMKCYMNKLCGGQNLNTECSLVQLVHLNKLHIKTKHTISWLLNKYSIMEDKLWFPKLT